jgi:SWI/SNF-related matrix-associated actin-dependent regulator of chromatin subfamily A-like protein 1
MPACVFLAHVPCLAVAAEQVEQRLGSIPPDTWQRLFPFQREGVRRCLALGGRCLLGDDMGLGKTVQA